MNTNIICYPHNVTGGTRIEPTTGRAVGTAMRTGRQTHGVSLLGRGSGVAHHCAIAHSAALIVSRTT